MSTQTDSTGTVFDPALHQVRGGVPLVRKADGRFVAKGKRKAINGKGAKPAHKDTPAAQKPPVSAPENTPKAQDAPDLPPLETPVADADDLLGEFATPTIKPGDPEPVEAEESQASATDPALSTVAPDAPAAAGPGELTNEGLSHLAVSIFEAERQRRIDPDEWKLKDAEKADLAATVTKLLTKYEVNPSLSVEGELMLQLFALHAKRATLPKTRAWLMGLWASFVGLFRRKKAPVTPPKKPSETAPAKPPEAPVAAVAPEPVAPPAPPAPKSEYDVLNS